MVVAVDSSGNGRNGTYDTIILGHPDTPRFVPGLLPAGGDLACQMSRGLGTADTAVVIPIIPSADTAWSFECSLQLANVALTLPDSHLIHAFDSVSGLSLHITTGGNGYVNVSDNSGGSDWAVNATAIGDFDPHHLAVAYDGSAVAISVDASPMTLDLVGTPLVGATYDNARIGGFSTGRTFYGILDEAAWYTSMLTGSQITAHDAAASVSFAAYTAAVLADSPWAYYHLNDKSGGWHVGNIGVG